MADEDHSPIIWWVRRDLRLDDNPGLAAAAATGRPVIPVFLLDEVVERHGACPKWRLGLGVADHATQLDGIGSRLILRRGAAHVVLPALARETGAGAVWWGRLYDPDAVERDEAAAAALSDEGVATAAFAGHVLFEPETVETKTGGYYKVYTPYWNAVRDREVAQPIDAPTSLPAPDAWPDSDRLSDWDMGAAMDRGAKVVLPHLQVGEAAARARLSSFLSDRVDAYDTARDKPAVEGTSGLSENLTYGEISIRRCWHEGRAAAAEGRDGAATFVKELAWREFAYHLVHHTPRITHLNWRPEWSAFPWNEDERRAEVKAWKQGRTGMPFVDAAMRELFTTGRMHNRSRMIVACYLTKHLMCHWRIGQLWFEDCLADWDPANNALGWQWSAGSGPDATPYFRVFNPQTQLDKFDPKHAYVDAWIAEGQDNPPDTATAYFDAIPKSWKLSADDAYPDAPIVGASEGREKALAAYADRDF